MSKELEKESKGQKDKFISLIIVVNTAPVTIEANENVPLKNIVQKALSDSQNTGRPMEDWELKLENTILDLSKKVKEYNLPDGQELFLSLKAGVGGN